MTKVGVSHSVWNKLYLELIIHLPNLDFMLATGLLPDHILRSQHSADIVLDRSG